MPRTCTKCQLSKAESMFHRQKGRRDGLHSWCKLCVKLAATARGKPTTPEQKRRWQLKTRYGITPEEVAALLQSQGGVCGICEEPPPEPVVDHDHLTKRVRGILCRSCNVKLGPVEQEDFRRRALAYLERAT